MRKTDKLNIELASQSVELAEYKTYYELTNLVCYYDQPNLNGVQLNNDKNALKYAATLKEMPVYAHYCVNTKGEPSFGGHEAYVDKDGNVNFNTTPIGVHTDVCIKDAKVDVGGSEMTLPCLFATQRIWKRNKNACAAILRLYSLGQLHNSWEISSLKYSFANGIKTLEDYVFEGNTFLGFDEKKPGTSLSPNGADPAYGKNATVISLSDFESNNEFMVAEALARDIVENKENGEGEQMENENIETVESTEVETPEVSTDVDKVVEDEASAKPEVESEDSVCGKKKKCAEDEKQEDETDEGAKKKKCAESAEVTVRDLRVGIWKAYYELHNRQVDCDVMQILPESHTAWLRVWDNINHNELDVTVVTYVVGEDDSISIVDEKQGKLTVNISEINAKIDEMTSALVAANEQIETMKASISELSNVKAKYDAYVAQEAAEKHKQDCAQMKAYMLKSKCFEESEFENTEISNMIDNLDYATAKSMIADRLVEKMSTSHEDNSETKPEVIKSELITDEDSIMSSKSKANFVRKALFE